MPRTRFDVARDAKIDEILDAAEAMVVAGGYPTLSVAAVARTVGVANSAVYWYFPSKDHLFVATLRRMLHEVVATKPPRGGVLRQARWLLDQLDEYEPLRAALHERAAASPEAAALDDELESLLRALVAHGLQDAVAPDDLPVAVDAFLALATGLVAQGFDRRRRDAALRFVLERFRAGTS